MRFFLAVFVSFLVTEVAAAETAGDQLEKLLADAWEQRLQEDPIFATRSGDHRYNDQLPRVSVADWQQRADARRAWQHRLEGIERAGLHRGDQINYDIFARQLGDELSEFEFGIHSMPISDRFGFHTSFPELPKQVPLVTVQDFENYVSRLSKFSEFVDHNIDLMRHGIRRGVTQPAVVFEGYREPLAAHVVDDPERSLLYEPLRDLPTTVPQSEHERLRAAAREAITASVSPGFAKFLKFMGDEYVPQCRGSIGASGLPAGRDFYRFAVRKFTTLDVTPEEVHAIGLKEVARIRAEMEEIVEQVEFEGDLAEFFIHLRDAPEFYASSEDELLMHVSYAMKRMEGKLPELFGVLPRMPCGVKPIPAYIAPQATAAYYQRPAGDGTRAGFYNMNTYNLPSRPLYTVEALSLHEAVPGHHLQIALQQELETLPEFRKHTGFTAFVEGWALYAERLGLEAGFYEDPYSDFGRLTMEIWRACRLVVDTGVHYFGWTRDEAIEYFAQNSALSLHNIRSEVDRYLGWPGQALAYKMGELKIRELRTKAEVSLGEQFDIRSFHDLVLGSGAVPLDVLEANVAAWIAEQQ